MVNAWSSMKGLGQSAMSGLKKVQSVRRKKLRVESGAAVSQGEMKRLGKLGTKKLKK
jgi:hypothetical protein